MGILNVLSYILPPYFFVSLDKKKMLETTVFFLLLYAHFGGAYNIDTTSPIKWTSENEGSLFGLSVALSKDYVYVGAPADDIHGNVYKCSKSRSCSVVNGKPFKTILSDTVFKRMFHLKLVVKSVESI